MSRPKIRPTFSIPLTPAPDEAMKIMRRRLEGSDWVECTKSKGSCADFFIEESKQRVWSPHLTVQVDDLSEGTRLRGRFAPKPEVWTLFVFLYFAVSFLAIMGLMLGFVQWQSQMTPWGFWGVGLGVPGLALLYTISAVGQSLSSDQMAELRDRVDTLVDGLEAGPASDTPEGPGPASV
jgi:hypothetical protein